MKRSTFLIVTAAAAAGARNAVAAPLRPRDVVAFYRVRADRSVLLGRAGACASRRGNRRATALAGFTLADVV